MHWFFLLALIALSACSSFSERSVEVTGRVVDASGQPLQAEVRLHSDNLLGSYPIQSVRTDVTGGFYLSATVAALNGGRVSINPEAKARYRTYGDVAQDAYFHENLDIGDGLTSLGDVELEPTAGLAVDWSRPLGASDTLSIHIESPRGGFSGTAPYRDAAVVTGASGRVAAFWIVAGGQPAEITWTLITGSGERRQGGRTVTPRGLHETRVTLALD